MKNKFLENIIIFIFYTLLFSVPVSFLIMFNNGLKESKKFTICKNVQKLYKDDILFDNFYITCNDKTLKIDPELYTRIIEDNHYKIIWNKIGGIYKIERLNNEK